MNRDDLYVTKINEGSELLSTGIYSDDFDTDEEYRIAGLKKLIKERDLFYDVFDIATTQYDKDSLRPMLDIAVAQSTLINVGLVQ